MNIFGKITYFFITNKKLSLLILIGIVVWGGISFVIIPKQYNPDIVAPSFSIEVDFPSATVDEVYNLVTKPLEDVLNEIPSIDNIYSKSVHGGRSIVVVEFFVGENLEESMIVLRQKISSRIDLSPLGVSKPVITSIDPEDLPIKTLALYSDQIDSVELRKRGFQLRQDLRLIDGVSVVDVFGGQKREFKIVLNLLKMQQSQTSLDEIQNVLARTSLLKDLGLIKAPHQYFHVETEEQATTVEDIENIIVASNFERFLRVKDIATVVEGVQERDSYVHYIKKESSYEDSVFVAISKQKGVNIVTVSKEIDQRLKELMTFKSYLKEVNVDVVKDEGRVADEEISRLIVNLIQAICIVFIVLLIFLNYRAAIIVALSIPLTLLTVIGLGNFFGYTLNRITLFALILSLGLLVDSATVVIENIVRLKNKGKDKAKEVLIPKAVAEVGAGLFLSTLTTVLAFIPMAFVTGMMGPYMGPIPFFVSCALIVSLVFAYTLNPWLAYVFYADKNISNVERKCGFICQILKNLLLVYQRSLELLFSSRRRRIVLLVSCFIVLVIIMAFPVVKLLRFRMLPKADREQVFVYLDLDRGTSIERSKGLSDRVVDVLKKEKNIKSIQSFVGIAPVLDFNGLFRGVSDRQESHTITLKLNLSHPDSRRISSEKLAYNFRKILDKEFGSVKDLKFMIVEDPPGPPVRSTFYVKIKSENPELLYRVADDLQARIEGIEGVEDIDQSAMESNKKFLLYVDKKAAAKSKVSVDSISKELETIFSGRVIGVYHSDYNLEQEYIVMRLSRDVRDNIDDLNQILVANTLGNYIPVSRFVKVMKTVQEDVIVNDDRERTVYIKGEMAKRSVTYAAIDLLKILFDYNIKNSQIQVKKAGLLSVEYLVDGKDELNIEIGGEWDLTVKVFRDLGLAMLVAMILIYFVLVAQFKSFLIPVLISATIPLALIGVIPGFALLFVLGRVYFSATSMIGVIALAGIVVNNAIIFIECVKHVLPQHDSLKDALMDAGVTRMRPILLTSVTTILGSLVIASDPVWSGLAWSIIFGLSLSSLLTLVIFPVMLFEFFDGRWRESEFFGIRQ